jgi:TrmH family RNA methyltransferase
MRGTLSQNRRRLVARLQSRKLRAREGAVLVEGVRAVAEAVAAGVDPIVAVVSPRLEGSDSGAALRERLDSLVETVALSDRELEELAATEQPQGVLLVCRQPVSDVDTLRDHDPVLVLDAVQDPGNVGTLVRSVLAFGWGGVVCLSGTTDPWGAKAVRASAGAVFRLPVWRLELEAAIEALAHGGFALFVASAEGRPIGDVAGSVAGPSALVLGNEGAGVRGRLRDVARDTVSVPMRGAAESLNVGVAGSILMYEWMRCTKR